MADRLELIHRGKVRDIYQHPDPRYIVLHASDRVSTFDSIHPTPIPGKGEILTDISVMFMQLLEEQGIPTHFVDYFDGSKDSIVVKKASQRPVEYIVRGFLYGSAWKAFQAGELVLPPGSEPVLAGKLSEPFFTPTTKAPAGEHDMPIGPESVPAEERDLALRLYCFGRDYAEQRGIILADTKFEFGEIDGQLIVTDEVLTPDSSRYWDVDKYRPGHEQESFDKQVVRDFSAGAGWDKKPPAPPLPEYVVSLTQRRYRKIQQRLKSQANL